MIKKQEDSKIILINPQGAHYVFIKHDFNFKCEPINFDANERGITMLNLVYLYFLMKVLDLLDTLFIILKKNNAQLSFLHCYHHFLMAFSGYIAARWIPGGPLCLLGIINAFVHGVMYFYYFITAFKPDLKKSIWWKKYITQIQLVNF